MELKQKDKLLLSYFRNNSRMSLTKISRKTGIPVSTIFDKLRNYEDNIILKHTSLIDLSKLGFLTRAHIFLKTSPKERTLVADYLKKQQYVNNLYRVNNGYDLLVEGIFSSVVELENFIETMENRFSIMEKNVFFVIEDIARERFLTNSMMLKNAQ